MSSPNTPRYLIINRFDDECGYYHDFLDGVDCELAYITLPVGLPILDQEHALETVTVDGLDLDTVLTHTQALMERHGDFDGIIGMSERDVLMTAQLRDNLGVAGWRGEFVKRFRDKPTMKGFVAGAGLRVPRHLSLDGRIDAAGVIARIGLPVVLKPRAEAAARGIVIAHSEQELRDAMAPIDPLKFHCEEYIDGKVIHVDGIRRDGAFHFVSASEYINSCLDFAHGVRMGSAVLDPGEPSARCVAFAAECLDALGLRHGPFHLELIISDAGELVFLEVGIRPGGAEISFIHQELFGVSLYGEGLRTTVGLPAMRRAEEFARPVGGGWVSVPEPRPLPTRVVKRNSLLGEVPEVYAEVLPEVGAVLDGSGGYDHIGGRFRLRGPDEQSVRLAVEEVFKRYEIVAEPIQRPDHH